MKDRYGNELRLEDRVDIRLEGTVVGFPDSEYQGYAVLRLDLSPYGNPCPFILVPTEVLGQIKEITNAPTAEAEAHGEPQTPDPDFQV